MPGKVTIAMTAWFMVSVYAQDGKDHNYLFEIPGKFYHVAATLDAPLEGAKEGQLIYLQLKADCEVVTDQWKGRFITVDQKHHYCNTTEVKRATCPNPLVLNGVIYC